MRFLKDIELNNYLNLKHARLDGLKDLNIIIGPNNCGKTSLLRAVNLLSRIEFGKPESFDCGICNSSIGKDPDIQSVGGSIDVREKYLTRGNVRAVFGYNKGEIMKVIHRFSERQNGILETFSRDSNIRKHLTSEFAKDHLEIKAKDRKIIAEHASPIIWNEVTTKIFGHTLFCPDERLQTYKGTQIPKHIESKNFALDESERLIEFLKEIVDRKILSMRQNLELVRIVENKRFNTFIAEQGSGVKSLICLVADILSATQTKILLVDEPELGLNPAGKHAFLRFLLKQSKDKQIFLATHDPTFVNPVLWNRENVSVYLFSIINDDFVKVDLHQSKQDPSTFAGFLPHTTSLKEVHIYVEGTHDVHIFQILLNKYLRSRFRYWYRYLNEIGIFHLAGDFWSHLLYTIPKRPYVSIVVLDGDKKPDAKEIVSKYSTIEKDRFQIFDSLEELRKMSHRKPVSSRPCPIYCLQRSKIEDYLEPRPKTKSFSKEKGPLVADKMREVPKEIEWIFDLTLRLAGITVRKPQLPKD